MLRFIQLHVQQLLGQKNGTQTSKGAHDCQAGSVLKGKTSPTLRGQILSSWSSSQHPPQTHLFSSFLCSSCLSSSLWFSSSFLLLHPGPGERSCWRGFHARSCAPTGRRLGKVNMEMEDDIGRLRIGINDHKYS